MLVVWVVLLVLLERVELTLEVADLGVVAGCLGCFDVGLVLLNVLVDRFHGDIFVAGHFTADGQFLLLRFPFQPFADIRLEAR